MKTRFTPHLVDLTFDATLRSFWRKNALSKFLERNDIRNLPTWLPDESKRDYLQRVFDVLEKSDQGKAKIVEVAKHLMEQSTFPDLEGWEDTSDKVDAAKRSVDALKSYMLEQQEAITSEQQKKEAQARLRASQKRARESQHNLQSLSDNLTSLTSDIGTSIAGIAFEKWFYDLMQFSEIQTRRPYVTGGRQIDGSVTIGDTTYLIECKFTTEQTGAPDIDIFKSKVESKADNTMGIFVSVSGYSSVAIKEASGRKSPLLLMDHSHLYRVLGGISSFRDVVERARRHASQTGESYIPSNKFSG